MSTTTTSIEDEFVYEVTFAGIESFAQASGGTGLIHTDPDFAARTQFGRPVAHGIYVLSLCRSTLEAHGLISRAGRVSAKFVSAVCAGDTVRIVSRRVSPERVEFTVFNGLSTALVGVWSRRQHRADPTTSTSPVDDPEGLRS